MQDLAEKAGKIRKKVLEMIYKTQSPHIGACFSCVDILTVLYFKILNTDLKDKDRDIFILSKGHAAPALYAVLAEKGILEKEKLEKFAVDQGVLEGHPKRDLELGIEATTGSLGQGLSVAAGMAKAKKLDNSNSRIFTLLSDGDLQEGAVWQALMFSSHHQLDNLTAIIDYNKLQVLGRTKEVLDLEPLKDKLLAFNWQVLEVDGHNFEELLEALETKHKKPLAIICHTQKGKGVSFMENNLLWHSKTPSEQEYNKALKEL